MQSTDGSTRLLQRTLVNDHFACNFQSLLPARLCGEHALRLLDRFGITLQQALHLGVLVTVDDEHAINESP